MNPTELRVLLDLYMVSDPWPLEYGNETLGDFLDKESRKLGYENWVVAYHELPTEEYTR